MDNIDQPPKHYEASFLTETEELYFETDHLETAHLWLQSRLGEDNSPEYAGIWDQYEDKEVFVDPK